MLRTPAKRLAGVLCSFPCTGEMAFRGETLIWAGHALGLAPFSGYITLVFAGSWDGPDGLQPPREVVASWIVEAVLWRP